jgi:hypothetical protein
VPYTAGSRVPSRFKFGPFSNKIRAISASVSAQSRYKGPR